MASKARLVITAVLVEGRSPSEVARTYGVARSWIYTLVARYHAEGDTAFEARSRRPKTSPNAIDDPTVELILERRRTLTRRGLDAGPETIAWHLEHHHQIRVHRATIYRTLQRAGLITPEPKKKPRSSYLRFEAEQPNECWQADFTHYPLADGTDTEILTWLDDHSRYALSITAHQPVTGPIVLTTFRAATAEHGPPASTLTDNGLVFPRVPRRAPSPARHVPRPLQPAPAPPVTPTPIDPRRRLPSPTQGHPDRPRRHPPPSPPRPHRHHRQDHPARRRPPPPHRHRTNPRPNPRHRPHRRPPRPNHRRHHRRTPPPTHHRPHPRLPTHRRTQRPHPHQQETPRTQLRVQGVLDVSRHDSSGGDGT